MCLGRQLEIVEGADAVVDSVGQVVDFSAPFDQCAAAFARRYQPGWIRTVESSQLTC